MTCVFLSAVAILTLVVALPLKASFAGLMVLIVVPMMIAAGASGALAYHVRWRPTHAVPTPVASASDPDSMHAPLASDYVSMNDEELQQSDQDL